ncbi:hypothetical protein KIN20_018235 [Parelaphostrongylus tenuis]|uniref:Uncharacterized protein n=1 Tax=Parelaphostrongylus tenuis TaxID=148309 RepID=A0AAD5N1Q5_PARTN|nr:hypothetical protein KIN20_018235 [Parelaphostrongylus tenuis]
MLCGLQRNEFQLDKKGLHETFKTLSNIRFAMNNTTLVLTYTDKEGSSTQKHLENSNGVSSIRIQVARFGLHTDLHGRLHVPKEAPFTTFDIQRIFFFAFGTLFILCNRV